MIDTPPSKAVSPNTPVIELIPALTEEEVALLGPITMEKESLLHHYWHEAVAGGLFASATVVLVAWINRDRLKRVLKRKK